MARLEYIYSCVNAAEGHTPAPPDLIPRPGVEAEPEPEPDPAQIAGFFAM